ncbi:uncharacterized protein QC761_114240 [Podospora bellae-mahoneyi]|uniref:PH domain-containing protein n=1 Tax=Podospora bellae-mahoneyi TaxID=2093777 RepID=A0ABR0FZ50_9PEZI|nr:hypothetical protein QC761_114240 [Podospora bellae-mahoneyi]
MELETAVNLNIPIEAHLLRGCCREADRCEIVAMGLDQLRIALPESFHGHLIALTGEIRSSCRLLRDLADRSQVHFSRVPIVANYLNVVLPCLSRTLKDIIGYYEEKTISREMRWRKMYNKMTEEASGLPLPQRFVLYNHFLSLLKQLLTRSPSFELNTLETLRTRILKLREQRGIERTLGGADILPTAAVSNGPETFKTSYGPFYPWGHFTIPPESKILFRRPFDEDRISIVVYLNSVDQSPYLLMRTMQGDIPWFSLFGAHELCINREGSALQLKRWSRHTPVPVADLAQPSL